MSAVGGFGSVAIIGIGLIGGSIAAALKQLPDAPTVVGIDTDVAALRFALEAGFIDDGSLPDGLGAGAGAVELGLGLAAGSSRPLPSPSTAGD